ncbi:CPBP family intramembrane glutamic endopeptidase [Gordonia sp. DT30]|uniref:CPBP family intramembrane glutamic endopeptidase n=1 Tax=Gordonia sp. DT30 TaxID=3416546 RepID=UPI003CE7CD1E
MAENAGPGASSGEETIVNRRFGLLCIGVVAILIVVQILVFGPSIPDGGWSVSVGAVLILLIGKAVGLTWDDVGLSPRSMGRGLQYAGVIVGAIAVIAAVGVALPFTRELFHNDAYRDVGPALYSALILIPLRTVLAEELIFRGVLFGALRRTFTPRTALLTQAGLFGLWHVASSLGLSAHNQALGDTVGTGAWGTAAGVLLAVLVTGFAGIILGWLRIRSGSLLAPIALHWAVNGVGAIAAAIAWHLPS